MKNKISTLLISPRNPYFQQHMREVVDIVSAKSAIKFYITTTEQQRSSIIADEIILKQSIEEFCSRLRNRDSNFDIPVPQVKDLLTQELPEIDQKLFQIEEEIFSNLLMSNVINKDESVLSLKCRPNASIAGNIKNFTDVESFVGELANCLESESPVHVIFPISHTEDVIRLFDASCLRENLHKEVLRNADESEEFDKLANKLSSERIKTSLRMLVRNENGVPINNLRTRHKSLEQIADGIAEKIFGKDCKEQQQSIRRFFGDLSAEMSKASKIYFVNEFPDLALIRMVSTMHYPFQDEAQDVFNLITKLCGVEESKVTPVEDICRMGKSIPVPRTSDAATSQLGISNDRQEASKIK